MKPRRGDIMVEYYWRYKLEPRRGGIIKSQDDFIIILNEQYQEFFFIHRI